MKKYTALILIAIFLLALTGCGSQQVQVVVPGDSDLYTEEAIRDAVEVVLDQYENQKEIILYSVVYAGDHRAREEKDYYVTEQHQMEADQVIVLNTSGRVNPDFQGNLDPDEIEQDVSWVLGRKTGGPWQLIAGPIE